MVLSTKIEEMVVAVFESNRALGKAAAADFAAIVKQAVSEHGKVGVIFATGNSQLSFLDALREHTDVPWNAITALHMDEYLGMSANHPASFRRFLREKVVEVFHPKAMYDIRGDTPDVEAELARYGALLEEHKPIVCVMGIGENGHLAFNDPPADFQTKQLIHVVTLAETCRRQQVGEGHFPSMADVPAQAISLTIPALLRPKHVLALVPEARKAQAVKMTLEGTVTPMCPASILRTQSHAKLYLDKDSASLVNLPNAVDRR
jgi:glucosamine-6-phosphate deaminase